jgi:hypothetical protein
MPRLNSMSKNLDGIFNADTNNLSASAVGESLIT